MWLGYLPHEEGLCLSLEQGLWLYLPDRPLTQILSLQCLLLLLLFDLFQLFLSLLIFVPCSELLPFMSCLLHEGFILWLGLVIEQAIMEVVFEEGFLLTFTRFVGIFS